MREESREDGGVVDTDMSFDRSVSDGLMDMLQNGPAVSLVKRARGQTSKPLYDLQLRSQPKGNETWATLYYGMTALINLKELKGKFKLTADKKYMALDEFDADWTTRQPREDIEAVWPQVERYLDAVAKFVEDGSALKKEGPVHAALASGNSDAYRVIQREARPSFRNKTVRDRRLASWVAEFNQALDQHSNGEKWWPKNVKVGSSLDILAVDIGGRLALIEAKADTASPGEIAKVPVQAGVYAAMFADLLRENPSDDGDALDAVAKMLQQRARLGLSRKGVLHLREKGQVVPVIAIGPGRPSKEVHKRMWLVARAMDDVRDAKVDPVEVWYLDRGGRIMEVERLEDVERAGEGG